MVGISICAGQFGAFSVDLYFIVCKTGVGIDKEPYAPGNTVPVLGVFNPFGLSRPASNQVCPTFSVIKSLHP